MRSVNQEPQLAEEKYGSYEKSRVCRFSSFDLLDGVFERPSFTLDLRGVLFQLPRERCSCVVVEFLTSLDRRSCSVSKHPLGRSASIPEAYFAKSVRPMP